MPEEKKQTQTANATIRKKILRENMPEEKKQLKLKMLK